jgi:hypothetical protein
MINKEVKEFESETNKTPAEKPGPKPNETGGFYFSSSVKIFDPNSKEVIVHKRGDD